MMKQWKCKQNDNLGDPGIFIVIKAIPINAGISFPLLQTMRKQSIKS